MDSKRVDDTVISYKEAEDRDGKMVEVVDKKELVEDLEQQMIDEQQQIANFQSMLDGATERLNVIKSKLETKEKL